MTLQGSKEQETQTRTPLTFDIFSKYRSELFGISIILIMMFHYFHTIIKAIEPGSTKFLISYIYCRVLSSVGVEVFLFLSGMGLYFSYTKNKDTGAFLRKRFIRVLIPYLIYGTVIWFITDCVVNDRPITRYFYDLSLFSFWISGEKRLWFISAIVIFYIFFPLFYELVTSKHSTLNTGLFILLLIGAMYVSGVEKPKQFDLTEIALTRLPIFIFGIYIGKMVYDKAKIKPWHIAVAVCTVLLRAFDAFIGIRAKLGSPLPGALKTANRYFTSTLGNRMESSAFSIGFMALCIALLMLIKWKPLHSFLKSAGGLSLELYMTHVTINGILKSAGLDLCSLPVYLLSMVISVSLAILLHLVSDIVIKRITRPAAPSELKG